MAKRSIIDKVRKYLHVLQDNGFPITGGVLYGSYARGEETPDSDIDVMVLSPLFDKDRRRKVGKLWTLAWKVDARIEPVPVGEKRYKTDNVSPLLEMARREGVLLRVRSVKTQKAKTAS
jgi:predicted nucleotidyltransferase